MNYQFVFFFLHFTFYILIFCKECPIKSLRVNNQIRIPRVAVIDDQNGKPEEMDTKKALDLAKEKDLDLVEVSPKARPPVCKLMDYGKHRYWQEKQEHKHRVKQKKSELKTIRLSIKISDHDLKVKSHQAQKFLKKGNKVQAQMTFKGREAIHVDLGKEVMKKFQELLKELSEVEKYPVKKGMNMSMILKPRE
ncbi:translation initiation factor IF-3 [Patescibacteria group bacterium]